MTWILTILSLIGVILNIKKNEACFAIWALTNFGWTIIDFQKGIPAQGILFLIYTGLAVWGFFEWRSHEEKDPSKR